MRKMLVVFIVVILISSCSSEEVVEIGMIVSLTGTYSPLLTTARNGAMLAVEEINSMNSKLKLNLIIEDDQSDTRVIIDKTGKLIEDGVNLMIFSVTSSAYTNVEALINENDVLVVSSTLSSDVFKNKDDNLIRMSPNSSGYAEALASHVVSENRKRVVIIYDSNNLTYAENMIKPFEQRLNSADSEIEIIKMDYNNLEDPSFKDLGSGILNHQPDTVLIIANPFDAALICQHIQSGDFLILSSTWGFSDELIKNGGRAVEGIIFYREDETIQDEGDYGEFLKAYTERFGSEPTFQSAMLYDVVFLYYNTLQSLKTYEPSLVKETILETGGYQGLNRFYEFNEYGDCQLSLQPYTVSDGKFVKLENVPSEKD